MTVTFERMVGAAMEDFHEHLATRMNERPGTLPIEDALRDTVEKTLSPIYELLRDAEVHEERVGDSLQVRTVEGSWKDVVDYFTEVTGDAS